MILGLVPHKTGPMHRRAGFRIPPPNLPIGVKIRLYAHVPRILVCGQENWPQRTQRTQRRRRKRTQSMCSMCSLWLFPSGRDARREDPGTCSNGAYLNVYGSSAPLSSAPSTLSYTATGFGSTGPTVVPLLVFDNENQIFYAFENVVCHIPGALSSIRPLMNTWAETGSRRDSKVVQPRAPHSRISNHLVNPGGNSPTVSTRG